MHTHVYVYKGMIYNTEAKEINKFKPGNILLHDSLTV